MIRHERCRGGDSLKLRSGTTTGLAVASSFRNVAIPAHTAVFGELGLSGEVRAVAGAERREAEARKLGYAHVLSPANTGDIAAAIQKTLG
jgi:DNA repair protein RadA/Sms